MSSYLPPHLRAPTEAVRTAEALLDCIIDEKIDAERPRRRQPALWSLTLCATMTALTILFLVGYFA